MDAEAWLLPLKSVALLPLTLSFSGLQTKTPSPPLLSWKARGPFPKPRGCLQVTVPCHCENVNKRQRSFRASGKPRLPWPAAGHRLKHPWAAAWLQVKPSQGKGKNKLNAGGLKHGQLGDSTQIPIQVTGSRITHQTARQLATSTRNRGFSF